MPEAGGGKKMLMKVFSPLACDVPRRAQAVRAYVFSQLQHPGCYFKSFSLHMELMAFSPRYINLSSLQTRGCWSSCFCLFHPTAVPDVLRVAWCFIVFDVSETTTCQWHISISKRRIKSFKFIYSVLQLQMETELRIIGANWLLYCCIDRSTQTSSCFSNAGMFTRNL